MLIDIAVGKKANIRLAKTKVVYCDADLQLTYCLYKLCLKL